MKFTPQRVRSLHSIDGVNYSLDIGGVGGGRGRNNHSGMFIYGTFIILPYLDSEKTIFLTFVFLNVHLFQHYYTAQTSELNSDRAILNVNIMCLK